MSELRHWLDGLDEGTRGSAQPFVCQAEALGRSSRVLAALHASLRSQRVVEVADVRRLLHDSDSSLAEDRNRFLESAVVAEIRTSTEAHLRNLDAALCDVPGMEGQWRAEVHRNMDYCMRVAGVELGNVLAREGATRNQVLEVLAQLEPEHLEEQVAAQRQRMGEQMRALRCLSKLCATGVSEFEGELQLCEAEVCTLANYPPADFAADLRERGAELGALTGVFLADSTGRVPVSFAVKAAALLRWLRDHGAAVQEACVAAQTRMRYAVEQPCTSEEWAGVALRSQTAGVPWAPPRHLDDGTARVLVRTSDCSFATRAGRFFSVLRQQIAEGLLEPGHVSSRALLGTVFRMMAENEVALGQVMAHLRSFAAIDRPQPAERRAASPAPSAASESFGPPVAFVRTAPTVVPPELEVSYAFVAGIARLLRGRAAVYLSPAEIAAAAASAAGAIGPKLVIYLQAPRVKIAASISKKLVADVEGATYCEKRNYKEGGRAMGIGCSAEGAEALLSKAERVLAAMRTDPAFCTTWNWMTASSQQHAREHWRERQGIVKARKKPK